MQNNPKKILYFHHSGNLGGAPKSLSLLIKQIDQKKYDPILVMLKDGPGRKLFDNLNIPVIIEPKLKVFSGSEMTGMNWKIFVKNMLGIIPTYLRTKKILKNIKPDIIHLNSTCLFVIAMAAKHFNPAIKIICHVREPLLKSVWGKILEVMNGRYIDEFIAISKYDEASLKNKSKSQIIYNAVDFNEFDYRIQPNGFRNSLALSKQDILITFIGRVVAQNGVIQLLEAAKLLKNNSEIKFVISGFNNDKDDGYQDKVKSISKVLTNVSLIDFRTDITDILASSDIIVFPSTAPHFARSLIEAAAMKKPGIASKLGGPNELIIDGKTGFLVPAGDPEALADSIKKLAEDEGVRLRMGENAYKFAQNNFDNISNSNKVFQIYENCI